MSKADAILAWLNAGHCIDQLTALDKFGTTRLAARIHDLKQAYPMITKRTYTLPSGARIAIYWMPQE